MARCLTDKGEHITLLQDKTSKIIIFKHDSALTISSMTFYRSLFGVSIAMKGLITVASLKNDAGYLAMQLRWLSRC